VLDSDPEKRPTFLSIMKNANVNKLIHEATIKQYKMIIQSKDKEIEVLKRQVECLTKEKLNMLTQYKTEISKLKKKAADSNKKLKSEKQLLQQINTEKELRTECKAIVENKREAITIQSHSIGNKGATLIAQALNKTNSLIYANLCFCKIDMEGAKVLGKALKSNTSLKGLFLGCWTKLKDESKQWIRYHWNERYLNKNACNSNILIFTVSYEFEPEMKKFMTCESIDSVYSN